MSLHNDETLHAHLRKATEDTHEALHRSPLLVQMMSPAAKLTDLRNVLQVFWQFYLEQEEYFSTIPIPRFTHECKPVDWLATDFANLFADKSRAPEIFANPKADTPPAAVEEYLAYLYVKQGSTLGGQVIHKQLYKQGILTADQRSEFFTGFGKATAKNWSAFLDYLAQWGKHVEARRVTVAAQALFTRLYQQFEKQVIASAL